MARAPLQHLDAYVIVRSDSGTTTSSSIVRKILAIPDEEFFTSSRSTRMLHASPFARYITAPNTARDLWCEKDAMMFKTERISSTHRHHLAYCSEACVRRPCSIRIGSR
eukprot:scaffold579_cov169-Pinguiococcus_pyrenoidosus.AAC.1